MTELPKNILDELYDVIASRRGGDPEKSYTAKLFSRGRGKIAQKVGEEAVETTIAALTESKERLISESADLLYHLMVMWADRDVTPAQVWAELEHRRGTTGVDQKKLKNR
ncbi:MAG: phosphoribosyl-ATP diphosphatase [Alphaproteobacteria bacterium]|nr:phosphoribosyl-ATP diphosphatase [Alphaproteobacteria bacterium]